MTAKPIKATPPIPSLAELPLIGVPTDWLRIIQAIVVGICTVITTFGAIQSQKNSIQIEKNSAITQQIKKQTDGTLTAAKKAIAISAQSLATATKKPEDIKAASEAWDAFEAQVVNQRSADEVKKP